MIFTQEVMLSSAESQQKTQAMDLLLTQELLSFTEVLQVTVLDLMAVMDLLVQQSVHITTVF